MIHQNQPPGGKVFKSISKRKCPKTTQEWNWNGSKLKTCKCQHNAIKGEEVVTF